MSEKVDERFLRIARMQEQGVSDEDLARIFGIAPEKMVEILQSEEYKQAASQAILEEFDKQSILNKGWDGIEEYAMSTVLTTLQSPHPDPDYALKAASVANKATRRGKHSNEPIQVAQNLTSIIQLHAEYVGNLQNNFHVAPRQIDKIAKKQTNFMNVDGVKQMLGAVVRPAIAEPSTDSQAGVENTSANPRSRFKVAQVEESGTLDDLFGAEDIDFGTT